MLKTDKERIVEELAAELGSAETLIVADYRGLTNKQLEALRDELLQHGARFRIVKNTLTRRAAEQAGADALLVMLEGPTAIAFIESSGDPAAVAKALAATAKETNVLALRGGMLEGKTLSGERGRRSSRRSRRWTSCAAQLVGAIVAPLTQLLGARLGAAARSARPHRRSHRAARGAGRGRGAGRRSGGRGRASCRRGGSRRRADAEAEATDRAVGFGAQPESDDHEPKIERRHDVTQLKTSEEEEEDTRWQLT